MIFELFKKVMSLIKFSTTSIHIKILSLVQSFKVGTPEKCPGRKYTIASEMRCAGNTGPWCRRMCSHVPVFSLFTYFADRP